MELGPGKDIVNIFFDDKEKEKIMKQESEFWKPNLCGSWISIILLRSSNINYFD